MPEEPNSPNQESSHDEVHEEASENCEGSSWRKVIERGWGHVVAAGRESLAQSHALARKSLTTSTALTTSTGQAILSHVSHAVHATASTGRRSMSDSAIWLNAILASDFSTNLDRWLGKAFNEGIPSVYDQAVDAVYNATHIGGGQLHRLLDGSHTVWGMWDKVRDARPDDTFLQEVLGYASTLGKDLASPVGIPLFGMSKPSYDQVAGFLNATFHIPRRWFSDMLHVNATELVGASIATISVALNWNTAETRKFAELAAGLGISSIANANPALAVVSLVTLSRSVMKANKQGKLTDVVNGLTRGGIGTGAFLATSAVVGGPVWIGLLSGMCVACVAQRATDHFDVSEATAFISTTIRDAIGSTCKEEKA